jgi:putative hydrolase of the HAD superfamily
VLLDAFGTLLDLDDPVGRLQRGLRERMGLKVSEEAAAEAFAAEVSYYADHCHEGRDPSSLDRLRVECAAVVLRELDVDDDPRRALTLLGDTIRYRAYDDVAPTLEGLRRAGVPATVVSNADYTLPEMLASAGVSVERVFSSAATGYSKPDPRIFEIALDALGVDAGAALHVGDTPAADGAGAAAAGVDVRILDRAGEGPPGTIASLTEILELIG